MRRGSFQPVAVLFLLLAACSSFGHYPFPSSPEEEKAAAAIAAAVQARNQAAVASLTELLGDPNPRVQTAALLGTMQLSNAPLDLGAAVTAIRGLQGAPQPYLVAAADAALILLDKQTPVQQRLALLLELTQSEEGFHRRMAVEAIRQIGDAAVLPALEAFATDRFDDDDGKDLGSEDQLLRQSAANFLSRVADERVLGALTTALGTSRDSGVRLYAAMALGRLDSDGAVAAPKAGLADPEEAVRTQAAAELARKGLPDGEPIVLEALRCRQNIPQKLDGPTSAGKPATAESTAVGSPAPETRRAAIEARKRADRLCSAYRETHRPPVVRSADEQQAFDAVVSAYELVLKS